VRPRRQVLEQFDVGQKQLEVGQKQLEMGQKQLEKKVEEGLNN